jgi:hypothetical protein
MHDRIEPTIRDVSARKAHDSARVRLFYRLKSIWTLVAATELPRADVQIGVITNPAIATVSVSRAGRRESCGSQATKSDAVGYSLVE